MLTLFYAHKLTKTRSTLVKASSPQVLIWNRGLLVLQILISCSLFPWWRRLSALRANARRLLAVPCLFYDDAFLGQVQAWLVASSRRYGYHSHDVTPYLAYQ